MRGSRRQERVQLTETRVKGGPDPWGVTEEMVVRLAAESGHIIPGWETVLWVLARGRHKPKEGWVNLLFQCLSLLSAYPNPQPSPRKGRWAVGGDELVRLGNHTHTHLGSTSLYQKPC